MSILELALGQAGKKRSLCQYWGSTIKASRIAKGRPISEGNAEQTKPERRLGKC